ADARYAAHLPWIERRRRREEWQGDVVFIGDDAEQDVAVKIGSADKLIGESATDVLHRIGRELEHRGYDAIALALRRARTADQPGEVERQPNARLRVPGFDDRVEDADIESWLIGHKGTADKMLKC